jgi:hypothetical protein
VHGSQVGGFLIGIGAIERKLYAWLKAPIQRRKLLAIARDRDQFCQSLAAFLLYQHSSYGAVEYSDMDLHHTD